METSQPSSAPHDGPPVLRLRTLPAERPHGDDRPLYPQHRILHGEGRPHEEDEIGNVCSEKIDASLPQRHDDEPDQSRST